MRRVIAGSIHLLTDIFPWTQRRPASCSPDLDPGLNVFDRRRNKANVKRASVLARIASACATQMPFYAIALIYLILPNLPLLLSAGSMGFWQPRSIGTYGRTRALENAEAHC
jgi:hypothetical protein